MAGLRGDPNGPRMCAVTADPDTCHEEDNPMASRKRKSKATKKKATKRKAKKAPARRKRATSRARVRPQGLEPDPVGTASQDADELGVQTTGRMIVTFLDPSRSGVRSALASMRSRAGVSQVSHARDFATAEFSMEEAQSADALVFDELGMAVVDTPPDRAPAMAALSVSGIGAASDSNVVVEPEYVNFAFDLDDDVGAGGAPPEALPSTAGEGAGWTTDYLRGYRDALDQLLRMGGGGSGAAAAGEAVAAATFQDTASSTWGLKATRVLASQRSGRGIKVAVLDTGFDRNHPDFAGRTVQTSSFIPGETVQDGNGHGTHCIGTSCGPEQPGLGPRYGIAFNARIFAGKVLSNAGSGGDSSILAGINWALQNRCEVISMSLGRRVRQGERPQTNYETAGRRALRAGTLIVAAAGNDSHRPFVTVPVSSPANAASIAAVAALDRFLQVARFSNRGINPSGGEINLAGPGVDVHSSWPMPIRLRSISGTSMATPHVAGCAALVAEESSAFRGLALYRELRRRARALPLPRADVGNGLVQV